MSKDDIKFGVVMDRNRDDIKTAIETGHRASDLLNDALDELEKARAEIANKDHIITELWYASYSSNGHHNVKNCRCGEKFIGDDDLCDKCSDESSY